MKHSVIEMTRAVRRRLERVVRNSREKDYARRALAVLHLWETQGNVAEVAHRVRAARSSVYRWLSLYETYGEDGLRPQARGRSDWKATEEVLSMLESIAREDPRERGYLRSRWSSQLLAMELESRSGVEVHATTVRRWLARLRFRYRRARPTTLRRDPRKAERLVAIEAVLAENAPYTEVFYVDEADVDLNPRIGSSWMRCAEQTTVPTPGQNQKHYLAGALHARTGRLVWTEHHRKTSVLFVKLLKQLRRQYRRARPARAPHLLAGLHESAALPCAAWKCRIRSDAACGPILPDFAMCWTARLRKARRASGRSPTGSVMHLTCATVAAGASAQAAARRWACCRHGATLRCLRPDITAPGDTARECSRMQWRRPTMCRARWGRCASLRWCGSRPTRNAGSGTP